MVFDSQSTGVVGEQAEQQAHEQHFERVAVVAAGLQRVVQLAHALGGAQVHRVLRLDLLHLVAGDEGEAADVLVQVGQRELNFGAGDQVGDAQACEVGHQHMARQVALDDAGKVVHRLAVGAVQVLAARFVLHQQQAGPEQIDEALTAAMFLDRVLEAGDALGAQAEDGEEVDPERLGLRALVAGVGPLLGERSARLLISFQLSGMRPPLAARF